MDTYDVSHLALHDGIVSNSSLFDFSRLGDMPILFAGDCREIAGADAAIIDGQRTAETIAGRLWAKSRERNAHLDRTVARAIAVQKALAQVYATTGPPPTTSDTALCNCEDRSRSDLDALGPAISEREVRLVGRFGMGACQGRYCSAATQQRAAEVGMDLSASASKSNATRWPIRPVRIANLAAFEQALTSGEFLP